MATGSSRQRFAAAVEALNGGDLERALQLASRSIRDFESERDALGAAKALRLAAFASSELGRIDLSLYERAVSSASQSGDAAEEARCRDAHGQALLHLGRFHEAVAQAEKSVDIARRSGDMRVLSLALESFGDVLKFASRHDDAASAYQEAITVSDRAGDEHLMAQHILSLSGLYMGDYKHEEALPLLQRAQSITSAAGDKILEAECLHQLANLEWMKSSADSAADLAERSRSLASESKAWLTFANATVLLGKIELERGNVRRSLELNHEALATYERTGDRSGWAYTSLRLAQQYGLLGDRERALELLHQIETEFRDSGEDRLLGSVYLAQAVELRSQGLLQLALETVDRAIASMKSVGVAKDVGEAQKEKAQILTSLGRTDEALRSARDAINSARTAGDALLFANARRIEAGARLKWLEGQELEVRRRYAAEVREILDEVLDAFRRLNLLLGQANTHSMLGQLATLCGPDELRALAHIREAADLYARSGYVRNYLSQLLNCAQLELHLGDVGAARLHIDQVLDGLEDQRARLAGDFSRVELAERWETAWVVAARIAAATGDADGALDVILSARARLLQEYRLASRTLGETVSAKNERAGRLGSLASRLLNSSPGADISALHERFLELARFADDLSARRELEGEHEPNEQPRQVQLDSSEATRLLERWPGAVYLDLFGSRHEALILRATPDDVSVLSQLTGERADLVGQEIVSLTDSLPALTDDGAERAMSRILASLGITPETVDTAKQPGHVFIAASAQLLGAPLHLMPHLSSQWRDSRVAYTASLALLNGDTGQAMSGRHPRVLAIGSDAGGIPLVDSEVEHVAGMYGQGSICVNSLHGEPAEALLEDSGEWDVLHIACHGWVEPTSPHATGLLLQRRGEPFLLAVPDIQSLKLRSRLVVLGGCSTGVTIGGGTKLEALGLVAAFMSATGARAVIAPLWRVRDDVAEHFSRELHALLLQGRTIADAVWEATESVKRHVAGADVAQPRGFRSGNAEVRFRNLRRESPAAWGPFAVFGDPSVRIKE